MWTTDTTAVACSPKVLFRKRPLAYLQRKSALSASLSFKSGAANDWFGELRVQWLRYDLPNSARHPLPLLQLAFQSVQIIHHCIESISITTIDFLNLHLNLVGKAHFHLPLLLFNNGLNSL